MIEKDVFGGVIFFVALIAFFIGVGVGSDCDKITSEKQFIYGKATYKCEKTNELLGE